MIRCGSLLLVVVMLGAAQTTPLTDADRQRALQLFDEHKFVDALPLLERLAAERSKDSVVFERLGFAVLANAAGIRDERASSQERIRARKILLQAQALGDNSDLLQVLLAGIPEDGKIAAFSQSPEVEAVMRDSEAAYGRGDLQQALDGYIRAFALDPHLYEAAVFAGDTYFKLKDHARACEWYARAVAVTADRETAYRYWGDALVAMGEPAQARPKFI
jgi:tetratricopeptide (TPR) repeat protein